LHSAVTRRDPSAEARGGWYPEQAVTPEEAIRAYTSGAAYAAIVGGVIAYEAPNTVNR
jgi:predicted amidohydrolase YtcJ